jgi:cytochrome c-type biogenesis protein CcmH/NrfG
MDVVVFSVVVVVLAAYVVLPLYRSAPIPGPAPAATDTRSQARRDVAAAALTDLETDLESGLIDRSSFDRERAVLEREPGPSD